MVGRFIDLTVAESIFVSYLSKLADSELERVAGMKLWRCETMLQGSWDEDVGKSLISYKGAEERIFRQIINFI